MFRGARCLRVVSQGAPGNAFGNLSGLRSTRSTQSTFCVDRSTLHLKKGLNEPRTRVVVNTVEVNRAEASGAQNPEKNVNTRASQEVSGMDLTALEDLGTREEFDWNKAWYPVAVLEDLEPLKPTPIQLLGREFVVWRDVEGEWRCFEDVCPHRLAPLSEGRIEPSDGSLMCSYHGWRFNKEGACVSVPQFKGNGICSDPRTKAKSFPIKAVADLLWLWPEDSPFAFINSAATYPPYGGYEESDFFQMFTPYKRMMPYPVDVLVENVVDLSHVPFAHHGIQGDRESAGWYQVKREHPQLPDSIFRLSMESMANIKELEIMARFLFDGGKVTQVMEFTPPAVVKYSFYTDKHTSAQSHVMAISVPVSGEESIAFWRVLVRKSTMPKLTSFLVNTWRPKWINHMESTTVLNGDMVLLCEQTNKLREREEQGVTWKSAYFCPTTADIPILLFREWFHSKAGGYGPKLPDGKPLLSNKIPSKDRATLLESYHSHTKGCKVCSGAFRNLKRLEKAANIAGCALGIVWLVFMKQIPRNGGVHLHMAILLGMGALLLMGKKFSQMKQHYLFVDYEHWKR